MVGRTGTAHILLGSPWCLQPCRSCGLQDIWYCVSMTGRTMIQLKAYVSCFIEYYRNLTHYWPLSYLLWPWELQRSLVPCREPHWNKIDGRQLHCLLAHWAKYPVVFCPPTHYSVLAYEAKWWGEKHTTGMTWYGSTYPRYCFSGHIWGMDIWESGRSGLRIFSGRWKIYYSVCWLVLSSAEYILYTTRYSNLTLMERGEWVEAGLLCCEGLW